MKAIFKESAKKAKLIEVDNTLEALQKAVGGSIEVVPIGNRMVIICDEEVKLKGLPPNVELVHDTVVGDVLFLRDGGDGEFTDLSEDNIAFILNIYG